MTFYFNDINQMRGAYEYIKFQRDWHRQYNNGSHDGKVIIKFLENLTNKLGEELIRCEKKKRDWLI